VHKGGLTGTGRAHNGDIAALRYLEVDTREGLNGGGALAVVLDDVYRPDDRP